MDKINAQELERIKQQLQQSQSSRWINRFDARQQRLIANSRLYASSDPAGLPGHNLMLILAQMADMLDRHE